MLDQGNDAMKFHFLRAAAYLRDDATTFAMLEAALETGAHGYITSIGFLPEFAHIRDDPRYTALMTAAQQRLSDEPGPA